MVSKRFILEYWNNNLFLNKLNPNLQSNSAMLSVHFFLENAYESNSNQFTPA